MGTKKRAFKWIFGTLGGLVLLGVGVALLAWSFPGEILTSERVSGWLAPHVRHEPAKGDSDPNAPILGVEIRKFGFFRRSIFLRIAPGCYSLASEPAAGTEVCLESAHLGVSFRLSRRHFVRITGLDRIDLRVSRGRFVSNPSSSPPAAKTGAEGFDSLRYLDREFDWGPVAIQVDRFELPSSKLVFTARVENAEKGFQGTLRSPKLALEATVDSPDFSAGLRAEVFEKNRTLFLSKGTASYRTKSKGGGETIALAGEVNAEYGLLTGDLDAGFSVNWKNPTSDIEAIRADDGTFRMRANELFAKANLKLLLRGKTPLGRLPLLTVDAEATMRPEEKSGTRPIDLDLKVAGYSFAGIETNSDLAVTLVPLKDKTDLRWRKGAIRIESRDIAKTIRILSKTAWAIPVPFNVFSGPVAFRTEPFRDAIDRVTIPATLTTDLRSPDQAFATETTLEIDIEKKDFALGGIRIAALLEKVQFRLPDYEPLAPTPALARDPRIVRYEKPESKLAAPISKRPAIALSIKGAPGSVVLLNRYFVPNLKASVDVETDPATEVFTGTIGISEPFDLRYLNRTVRFERLDLKLRPELEVAAHVSTERAGYLVFADLRQRAGKTHIDLGSKPPLSESEIVSLLLYGMPGNAISSEQTRSVGSAQAAMSSEALGIFSFWAFASTPIESVLYDPETQTYSAVVKLPGGVVASIGSNWENERQLALSKSLGKSWAVSTELIRDAQGIDRGGTLLRWRKSY